MNMNDIETKVREDEKLYLLGPEQAVERIKEVFENEDDKVMAGIVFGMLWESTGA